MRTAFILILLVVTHAQAQTNINIDFGSKSSSPPATYAAAGMPGIWNVLTSLNSTPTGGIIDTNGNPTSLTIASSQSLIDVRGDPGLPSIPEPTKSLLGDYLCGISGDLTLTFNGILPGRYRLITYAIANQDSRGDITPLDVIPFGDLSLAASISGFWEGSLEVGETHTIHDLTIPAAPFTLRLLVDNDAYSNGIQLIELPDPCGLGSTAVFAALLRRRQRR